LARISVQAIAECASDLRILQAFNRRIAVIRGVHNVAVVNDCCNPTIDAVESGGIVCNINILARVQAAVDGAQPHQVIKQSPVGSKTPEKLLPHMVMVVNESGKDNAIGGVNDRGGRTILKGEVFSNGLNVASLNQNVASLENPNVGVHGDNCAILKQVVAFFGRGHNGIIEDEKSEELCWASDFTGI
jgi:hypothetical protein